MPARKLKVAEVLHIRCRRSCESQSHADPQPTGMIFEVLGHEPDGQSRDPQRAALNGLLFRRVMTMRHGSQDGLCAPSGSLWRNLGDVRDGIRRTGAPRPEPAR
jgi:hypothetical protein